MENLLIAIVILLAILVIGLLGVVVVFLSKLIKLKETNNGDRSKEISAEVMDAIEQANQNKSNVPSQFCIDHPELVGKGMCSISNEVYCELCLTKEDDVKIARKYLDLWLDFEWEDIFMVSNEVTGADKLNELIRLKKEFWHKQNIPLVTQKQFKINIENDRIEAYTMVKGRAEDRDLIKTTFDFLNS